MFRRTVTAGDGWCEFRREERMNEREEGGRRKEEGGREK